MKNCSICGSALRRGKCEDSLCNRRRKNAKAERQKNATAHFSLQRLKADTRRGLLTGMDYE